jgi:hypothetical protein
MVGFLGFAQNINVVRVVWWKRFEFLYPTVILQIKTTMSESSSDSSFHGASTSDITKKRPPTSPFRRGVDE